MKISRLVAIMVTIGLLLIFGSITALVWTISPGVAVLVAGVMLVATGSAIYEAMED